MKYLFQAVKLDWLSLMQQVQVKPDEEIETTIRQVIDQALVSDQVIDVFDAAGIKSLIFLFCQMRI